MVLIYFESGLFRVSKQYNFCEFDASNGHIYFKTSTPVVKTLIMVVNHRGITIPPYQTMLVAQASRVPGLYRLPDEDPTAGGVLCPV